jgi:hypothetical protein
MLKEQGRGAVLVQYQSEPTSHGVHWDEKRLRGGKGSLAKRASKSASRDTYWLISPVLAESATSSTPSSATTHVFLENSRPPKVRNPQVN